MRFFHLALALCLMLGGFAYGQQTNSAAASLIVNENDEGAYPRQSFLGRLDPSVLKLEGPANADYFLLFGNYNSGTVVPGLGTLHIRLDQPWGTIGGQLDASGNTELMLPPGSLGSFPVGTEASLQALVNDPTAMFGFALSGATQVEVVSTMTAPLLLTPGENSRARARGEFVAGSTTSIMIAGITMVVTPTTQFENFTQMSDLVVGDWIVAQGLYDANGNVVAEELCLEDSEGFARVKGRVQGIGPSGFSVLNVGVFVNSDTTYVDIDAPTVAVTLADLAIGMMIEFMAPVGMSFPAASSVELNTPFELEPEPEAEPEPEPETEIEIDIPPSFCS